MVNGWQASAVWRTYVHQDALSDHEGPQNSQKGKEGDRIIQLKPERFESRRGDETGPSQGIEKNRKKEATNGRLEDVHLIKGTDEDREGYRGVNDGQGGDAWHLMMLCVHLFHTGGGVVG